jgi:hypothetical protein
MSRDTRFKPVHGMSETEDGGRSPTYTTWRSMRQRCNRDSHKSFENYGGRGVTVCARWDDYAKFLEDMGERPDGMSLGRIDNDKPYEPNNCRWETPTQQARNRRSTYWVLAFGQKRPLVEWSEAFGVRADTIKWRLTKGMSAEQAVSMKPQARPA